MGTQRVQNERLPSLVVRWACCAGIRDFLFLFAALVGPLQTIFFLTAHYFNAFVPIDQQASQAAVPGRLSVCVSE
jgi:hypothetical protein